MIPLNARAALLVLFWHSFMAFIVPLFLAETLLTSSREMFVYALSWAKRDPHLVP